MSDLLVSTTGLEAPPQACTEAPPPPTSRGTHPPDGCHLQISFTDTDAPQGVPRPVLFDRAGDQFVLSPGNSLETREWFEAHPNVPSLFQSLRLLNGILRVQRADWSRESTHALFTISQYVTSGEVRRAVGGEVRSMDMLDFGRGFLEIFADTREDILGPLLGQMQVVRRSAWLSEDALGRLRWVTSIVDLVPRFRALRRRFVEDAEITNFDSLDRQRQERLGELISFCSTLVVANTLRRPLRFDRHFLEANDAYQALYEAEIAAGEREDFCTVMENALRELRGQRGGADRGFVQECRQALRLRELSPEESLRETFRASLLSEAGLRSLQERIAAESEDANMTVEWLAQRGDSSEGGRIRELLDPIMAHLGIRFPESDEALPELSLNVPALILQINTLIDAHSTTRREYILAALALVRELGGEDADESPAVRVFVRDSYRELVFPAATREELRRFARTLAAQLETSQEQSDIFLPILESAVCAVGIAGLLTTELVPGIRSDEGLHLGLGGTSAALTGSGCTALMGHYFWPAVTEVRNHYLWDGLTGLTGAAVGVGLYFLIQLLGQSEGLDPGTRFPTDEYGP